MSSSLLKPLLLVALVLVVPVVLIAFWGEPFVDVIERWQQTPPPPHVLAAVVVALLASDVLLPIPSGPINTLAGGQLGFWWGTVVCATGMTCGAVIAFGLARAWGRPLAERLSSPKQLRDMESACHNHGLWMVLVTRPLPVLAEACALLVGTLQMRWQAFLPTVMIANLLIAATYCALGHQANQYGWLPLAVCASAALPLGFVWYLRRRKSRVVSR